MVDASMGEIMTTCEKIHWLISEGERWLKPEYRSCGRSMLHKTARVEFHPLGVVGAIVSWNYPFHNLFNPVLAAVFSGNGIVVKVSENASWSGCFYVRILQTALAAVGAPENLVEVITRFAETGEALVSCVDKMIFVGSPGVGRMIMRKAADTLIPVTLELGGKDPFIVCEDVDVPHMLTMRNGINLYSMSVPPGLLQPQQLPYSRTGFNEGNEPPNMTRLNHEPHMNPMLNLPIQSTNQSQPSIPNLSHIMNQGPSFSFRPPLGPFKECLINSNVSDGTQLMNSEQKLVLPDNLNGGLHQK